LTDRVRKSFFFYSSLLCYFFFLCFFIPHRLRAFFGRQQKIIDWGPTQLPTIHIASVPFGEKVYARITISNCTTATIEELWVSIYWDDRRHQIDAE